MNTAPKPELDLERLGNALVACQGRSCHVACPTMIITLQSLRSFASDAAPIDELIERIDAWRYIPMREYRMRPVPEELAAEALGLFEQIAGYSPAPTNQPDTDTDAEITAAIPGFNDLDLEI